MSSRLQTRDYLIFEPVDPLVLLLCEGIVFRLLCTKQRHRPVEYSHQGQECKCIVVLT